MPLFALLCFVGGVVFEGVLLLIEMTQVSLESLMYAVIFYGIAKVFYMEILKHTKKKVSYKLLIEMLQSFCLGMFIPNVTALVVLGINLMNQNKTEPGIVLVIAGVIFFTFMFKNRNEVSFKFKGS